jgi:hypothetical protein
LYFKIVTYWSGKQITEYQEKNVKPGDKFFISYKTEKVEYFADQAMEIFLAFTPG